MKIEATPVRVYSVRSASGKDLGLFCVESEWEGLVKLRALDGKTGGVIIEAPERHILADIFAPKVMTARLDVVRHAASLADVLNEPELAPALSTAQDPTQR